MSRDFSNLTRWKDETYEEFYEQIEMGEDINIFIGDILFWLGAGENSTRIIAQCNGNEHDEAYKDADELLNNFTFEGKTLREHFPDIEFTSC